MATTRRNHLTTTHDRSPFISERRRKLFPIDDYDMDSELGQPLCSDTTSSDSDNEGANSICNYDITGVVQNNKVLGNETPMSTKACSDTMSPLRLSPFTRSSIRDTPKRLSPSKFSPSTSSIRETPKFSPSQNWKTPHDSSTKPLLQKEQKTLLEESKSLKRKNSSDSSPEQNKNWKMDSSKTSKVRTALFPPEEDKFTSLPTKSFYSKNQEDIIEKLIHREEFVPKLVRFPTVKHNYKNKKKFGQINNGVRHKIRKPKHKQISKAVILKASKKLMDTGSALTEYIQDLAALKNKQKAESKLIVNPTGLSENVAPAKSIEDPKLEGYLNVVKKLQEPKKLINTPVKQIQQFVKENKENYPVESRARSASPEDLKSRKFFKSSRAKIPCKPQNITKKSKDLTSKIDDNKCDAVGFNLINKESQDNTLRIQLETSNDFEDEDLEPQADIGNILSSLSDESPQKTLRPECQSTANVLSLNSDMLETTSSRIMDNTQFQNANSNILLATTNPVNHNYVTECSDINGVSSNNQHSLVKNGSAFENIGLEHHVVSSQVVFDNILLEEEIVTTSNTNSIQNGPVPAISNGTNSTDISQTSHYSNKLTLEAHKSILASENSILLHQNDIANMILSPISQMCDVTSGLALSSPKKGRNLTMLLNSMSNASKTLSFNNSRSVDMEQQQKLFPVFYPGAKGAPDRGEKRERGEIKRSAKRFKALHDDQMLLDAGQKKFGYTVCNECNIVYYMGDPGDELEHTNYHNASHILRFSGWKNEHLVADFQKNGKIIKVLPTDSKIWLKKVKDLMEFVKRDLGCYEMEYDISGSEVYLYIKNRTIAGCVVATVPKEGGHRMLSTLNNVAMCSEESYPIKCGISHIWVALNYRKQGIATALMDAVKKNFIYGYILENKDIALTSPTEAGSAFAEKYFKTPNYLVYYM